MTSNEINEDCLEAHAPRSPTSRSRTKDDRTLKNLVRREECGRRDQDENCSVCMLA